MKSTSSLRGSHRPSCATPLTLSRTVTMSATRDSDRPRQGALREHSGQMAAIVGRGVDVGVWIDELGGAPRRRLDRRVAKPLALENLLGGLSPPSDRSAHEARPDEGDR